MDPEDVIAAARGSIDEALLTRTDGGLLGRAILADRPLVAYLDEGETLHYLLAGPVSPERIDDARGEPVETTGSYRTVLAVTDRRLLLVVGSDDGDRGLSLPYEELSAVDVRVGLLTDTVVLETRGEAVWTVSVGAGSDVDDAVAYATGRIPADPGTAEEAEWVAGESTARRVDAEPGDRPTEGGSKQGQAEEAVDGRTGTPSGEPTEDRPEEAALGEPAGADEPTLSDVPLSGEGSAHAADSAGDAEGTIEATPDDSEFVAATFETVAGLDRMPSVEGYADGTLADLIADLEAHMERLRTALDAGNVEAAVGAAASVDAVAAEGARLAADRGEARDARRIAEQRTDARRAAVAATFGIEEPHRLDASLDDGVRAVLQAADTDAFEQFVEDLWSELGFQTAVAQSSGDRGVEVVARRAAPVEQTVFVQPRRDGRTGEVGRDAVQQSASVYRQESEADLVVVVSTGAFTEPAREAAKDLGVKLVDGDRLAAMVVERDCLDLLVAHAGR